MIREELIELVKENLDINEDEIDFEKEITEYDIEFSDDELDEIEKFSDVISLIESKN